MHTPPDIKFRKRWTGRATKSDNQRHALKDYRRASNRLGYLAYPRLTSFSLPYFQAVFDWHHAIPHAIRVEDNPEQERFENTTSFVKQTRERMQATHELSRMRTGEVTAKVQGLLRRTRTWSLV